ncbi:MAG: hypothetical protein IK081_03185 [Lachnospiraceae bacterium]|nr:hypothetical protein [Lachnospiraceae bacterium]
MQFDELWKEVMAMQVLPEAAHLDLPSALSKETKTRMCAKNPKEAARIFLDVISEIDQGSVETINSLVDKRL